MKHPKINMYYLSDGRVCVTVPDEIAKQIWAAEKERLSDELPPCIASSIQRAKKAIEEGRVLPSSELNKKRKAYNDLQNEGGEGYNPYDDYLTLDYITYLKKEFPDQF